MANKMLIDASHPEETRVVVLRGNRVEEFDFESASKRPLRGNIYLAKVTRVEPSLQAAFIEYGGNRHGFLAFSEIHPDYYQIPVADRLALLEEEARNHRDEDEEEARPRRNRRNRRNGRDRAEKRSSTDETLAGHFEGEDAGVESFAHSDEHREPDAVHVDIPLIEGEAEAGPDSAPAIVANEDAPALHHEAPAAPEPAHHSANDDLAPAQTAQEHLPQPDPEHDAESVAAVEGNAESEHTSEAMETRPGEAPRDDDDEDDDEDDSGDEEEEHVEQVGGDEFEDMPARPHRLRRQYKIQEVIKRRQVLLVQVVKEERGNKGAALTTYLSLAGRYSVLMPNTARGGGISRKITDPEDRKRLKVIAQDLEVPEGMGVILRTAGASRTRPEVKRDFEYLLRMWESVRELTLKSSAPTLVYEEGSLIKRAIRDLFNKDIDDVVVSGEEGYREARDFMRLLMPDHVDNVINYKDPQPIFAKAGAEAQLDAMFSNHVTLKSGGYLVINQTEALVAIDVNSGRSTREHHIEDTALRTNLEAADEVARQLRLRDLAGLIVVDFIDMEEHRNNRAVERRVKEALKNDRARIQVGRISHFGLLEMSRQRIRTGVLEGSTVACPHCAGAGTIRSTASIALHVLRALEDVLIRNAAYDLIVRTRTAVALYILNQKRPHLRDLEERFGVTVTVAADETLTGMVYHAIERGEPAGPPVRLERRPELVRVDSVPLSDLEDEEEEVALPVSDSYEAEGEEDGGEDSVETLQAEGEPRRGGRRPAAGEDEGEAASRRRRRRRRRGRGSDRDSSGIEANAPQPSDAALEVMAGIDSDLTPLVGGPVSDGDVDEVEAELETPEGVEGEAGAEGQAVEAPRRRRRPRRGPRVRNAEDAGSADQPQAIPAGDGEVEAPRQGGWRLSPDHAAAPVADELPFDVPEATPAPVAAVAHAPVMTPPPVEAPPAPVVPAPEPEPVRAPVVPEIPEAAAPEVKRSGWWQRAKATLRGE